MSFHFDVAISYLTRDSSLAEHLKRQLSDRFALCTFIYPHEQATLAAQGIEDGLGVVFEHESRVVIVVYREDWGSTGGTLIEKRAITRRRNRSGDRFLLVLNRASDLSDVPWKDEQFYYDLNEYPLDGAIEAAAGLVKRHREAHFESSSIAIVSRVPEPVASEESFREELRNWLVSDFFETGHFEGHFGANGGAAEATRWQSKGGENVTAGRFPKLPYYLTHWGYRAAFCIAPDKIPRWKSLTTASIARHFGTERWLKVELQVPYSAGPTATAPVVETVRHTARAAEVLLLIGESSRRVSEMAWELVRDAPTLQSPSGGWYEFRGDNSNPSLWASAYVFRFLSLVLEQPDERFPNERTSFQDSVAPLLQRTLSFLRNHWHRERWAPDNGLPWDEGTVGILPEIGPFIRNLDFTEEAYDALHHLLTPAGRLCVLSKASGAPSEFVQTLRLCNALRSANAMRFAGDSRAQSALSWLREVFCADKINTCDVAFICNLFDLRWRVTGPGK